MKQILLDLTKPLTNINISEDSEIWGVFSGYNTQKADGAFRIIHSKPGLKTRINIKAVLKDNSSLDLAPLIVVEKGAVLCDTYLKIAVLILSPTAHAKVIPGLEIMENNVKAGHGVSIGRPDREQLLYLRSRGLDLNEAESLLISAFLSDLPAELSKTDIY